MMISFASTVCLSPSTTSIVPGPASRAVPLIHVILFFLNRNSTPLVRPPTILSLRACTCVMLIAGDPGGIVTPQSAACWITLSAWACSRSALVGIHPQIRHVPPSALCFSTTATVFPNCAARMAATYPPVPAPITTMSYDFGTLAPLKQGGSHLIGTLTCTRVLNK